MPVILLQLIAAALYISLAAVSWRSRWHGPVLDRPPARLAHWERLWLLVALLAHGTALADGLFAGGVMHFSFSIALSLIFWLAVAFYWIESFYIRMGGLQVFVLPAAVISVLLPIVFPAQHMLINADSLQFRAHFLIAMLAYSLFTLAALHAILMAIAEQRLHSGRLTPLLASLPPLLAMETLLFRLINIAFVLLTLTLLSGTLFSESLFGKALTFDHKTVFAFLSWFIFAYLLWGRHFRGWRGRKALRLTLTGFAVLLLAYVGSRFVLEVLLSRG
ncbi:MAG: cytochrome c biogenesis protein CcsA [Zoogloeaceae bacterium]|jgi:ABC-type uncharacterized transport system permease subunit|nr:cytochrome c biogenesis protein CcsA [Zoogloeaceae bacterium]